MLTAVQHQLPCSDAQVFVFYSTCTCISVFAVLGVCTCLCISKMQKSIWLAQMQIWSLKTWHQISFYKAAMRLICLGEHHNTHKTHLLLMLMKFLTGEAKMPIFIAHCMKLLLLILIVIVFHPAFHSRLRLHLLLWPHLPEEGLEGSLFVLSF